MIRKALVWVLAVVAAGAVAGAIWFLVAGNVGDPTEVTAPLITSASSTTSAAAAESTTRPTEAEEAGAYAPQAESTTLPTEGEETEQTHVSQAKPAESPGAVELELSEGTEARFLIREELRGERFTVVGVTTEVVGRMRVDLSDLSRSQMGEILINARTFVTDSSNRNRAIRGPILAAEQYEFITFRPTEVIGLSGAAETEGEYSFSVVGELVVRDISRPVTFEVVARWTAGERLEGTASAIVLRSDFDLSIPSVPFVANVADEIGLELDFTAARSGLG